MDAAIGSYLLAVAAPAKRGRRAAGFAFSHEMIEYVGARGSRDATREFHHLFVVNADDGFFVTDPTAQNWYDLPAFSAHRHDYSYPLVFADGRADVWRHHRVTAPAAALSSEGQSSSDRQRLAEASTAHK